ncbi:E3 ubiquitin-protein ligase mib1-like isoform X2 [Clytia hemisphaerica]|uniref:E3 ubiquitin-protein ligase mib1-like isoform X2 n=1 Tax=Clytia hemisphaerica TaxID=252671 RepID=UPI0034D59226
MAAAASPINNFLAKQIGVRVIRGPDWKWGKQDGGEGHVGTVRSFESHEEVVVVWDNGTAANYRCSGAYDLRIFDSGPAGIKHDGTQCCECQSNPIYGTLWKCVECTEEMCSTCYHNDRHNLRHRFHQLVAPGSNKVLVEPRRKSKKITARGMFPGSRVIRGVDWHWESQDGRRGKITEIQDWSLLLPRSAAYVVWDTGAKNLYRLGSEGMVDLKCVSDAKGPPFYRDHLPMLGEMSVKRTYNWQVADYVRVDLELEVVQSLQFGHGGWAYGMEEALGNSVGIISGFDDDGDVVVSYPSGNRWTFNPAVLSKVNDLPSLDSDSLVVQSLASMSLDEAEDGQRPSRGSRTGPFVEGDVVQILNNRDRVKLLQEGHGEWTDAMNETLGKIGSVTQVYQDGDLKVEVNGTSWTFNRKCVVRIGSHRQLHSDEAKSLLKKLFEGHSSKEPSELLVKAAAEGNLKQINELFKTRAAKVDEVFAGHTALQAACQNGQVEAIKLLLEMQADTEIQDKDGDRAIHHATFCDKETPIRLLIEAGADICSRNKRRQSALHVAVNKGHLKSIETLLELNIHANLQDSEGDTALHDAITKKRDDVVAMLLEQGADISMTNYNGFNAVHHAALRGSAKAIEMLLRKNEKPWVINEQKDDGYTPLHLASLNNHLDVVQLLIKLGGANKDYQSTSLQTPLHLAIQKQHADIVRFLVLEGAKLSLQDKDGDTPLHEALQYHTLAQLKEIHDVDDVQTLITNFGQPNTTKQPTNSALIACFLVAHGADLNVENAKGLKPIDLCPDSDLEKILQKCHKEYLSTSKAAHKRKEDVNECIVCSQNHRDVIFTPCNHVVTCEGCAVRIKKCLLCRGVVESWRKIDECMVCSDKKANVLFKPCSHVVVCRDCARLMKKCVECRSVIESTVPLEEFYHEKKEEIATPSSPKTQDVNVLSKQLEDMKEQIVCVVCLDRRKNMIFLCGHGACQLCGDKLVDCPICRKPIEKRILVF